MIGRALAATAEAGAHDVPFYQEPEVWLLVAFALFVGMLAKPLWTRMTGGLDGRAERIKAELDEARQLREEAQAALANYQRKQRDAAKEAEEIVKHAEEEAARLTADAEKTLAETLKRREALSRDRIAQAEARAIEEVKDEAVEVALAATRALITERLDPAKAEHLIDAAVTELPAKLR
ncbi:MAG: F0F1 ATP synthase subunit B [Alphaproteobacteria bacterium]|nr:F0F1 ATP synthase subunit B [Alphaproteobacteria bacterium]